ncbi:MAG: DUF192 domain-containing protein [Candidatus Margulisiibacteriota bacterium]
MLKILNLIILIHILLAASIYSQNLNYLKTCIKNHCFDTRVSDTPELRVKGLTGEQNLPKNEGMLFLFPNLGKPSFWMKGTKITLDILFINEEDIIVYSVKNAEPCNEKNCPLYTPTREVNKVLEINGGISNELGIKVGDEVTYFMEDE